MGNFLQVFYTIFSAILFALALPNELLQFGSPICGVCALIPFYMALSRARSYGRAMRLMMLQTLTVHLLSSFWLGFFKDAAALTLGASAVGTALLSALFGGLLFVPWAAATRCIPCDIAQYAAHIPFRILWFPTAYVIWEWVKSSGFLGYPWGTLSTTAFAWRPVMQIADITGTYGVTFLFALFAACVGEWLCSAQWRRSAHGAARLSERYWQTVTLALILWTGALLYGLWQYTTVRTPEKYVNAVLVQQNFDPWRSRNDEPTILLSERLSREHIADFTDSGESTDVVVWSEVVLTHPFPDAEWYYRTNPPARPLIPFIAETGVPFIIGGSYTVDAELYRFQNTAFFFTGDGVLHNRYGKIHLVPFAEALPGMEIEAVRNFILDHFGFTGWYPGTSYTRFYATARTHPGQPQPDTMVSIAVPICYDDAFPSVIRPFAQLGTELFINMSDDSWSRLASAEYQHFVVAAYRAIETRTTLVRSTNAGYSVVLDPTARILADMPLFSSTAAAFRIPVYAGEQTAYVWFGNWLPALCTAIAAVVCLYFIVKQKRRR
ncbi:MAG: apolipoprotein N-acyltransferase [Treponema sp.]|nr:apolipoprotein N-acyltransferase [Treponema sp.]